MARPLFSLSFMSNFLVEFRGVHEPLTFLSCSPRAFYEHHTLLSCPEWIGPGPWGWRRHVDLSRHIYLPPTIPRVPGLSMLVSLSSAVKITDCRYLTQPRESRSEEAKIPRDTALAREPDVPPEGTETRAADIVESNTATRPGPEVESQKEATETSNQEAQSEQEKMTAVSDTRMVGTKRSLNPLNHDIMTE